MSVYLILLWALHWDTVPAASPPRRSDTIGNLAAGPLASSNPLSPVNIVAPSSNTSSSGNSLTILCDSTKYGKNLKVPSCRNVFKFLYKDETQFTFAERDSGVPFDVPLPLRTLSNDGLCFVQPVLKKGAISGHASPKEIGLAAYTMLQNCVVQRGMGGMAMNIGGDNNINVAIADYRPNVKCDPTSTPGPAWNSTVAIFSNMRATKRVKVFGYPEDRDVQEQLPLVLEASDRKCQASIDINGPATVATWYEIWEAVTAIASMCTRQKKKGGKAKGLGLAGNINLELSANKFERGDIVGNSSTVSLADAGAGAGAALQHFETASPQAGLQGFDEDVPFELVTASSQDGNSSSLVTLPGDSWTNESVAASA